MVSWSLGGGATWPRRRCPWHPPWCLDPQPVAWHAQMLPRSGWAAAGQPPGALGLFPGIFHHSFEHAGPDPHPTGWEERGTLPGERRHLWWEWTLRADGEEALGACCTCLLAWRSLLAEGGGDVGTAVSVGVPHPMLHSVPGEFGSSGSHLHLSHKEGRHHLPSQRTKQEGLYLQKRASAQVETLAGILLCGLCLSKRNEGRGRHRLPQIEGLLL